MNFLFYYNILVLHFTYCVDYKYFRVTLYGCTFILMFFVSILMHFTLCFWFFCNYIQVQIVVTYFFHKVFTMFMIKVGSRLKWIATLGNFDSILVYNDVAIKTPTKSQVLEKKIF
jgi:hypothetical protein